MGRVGGRGERNEGDGARGGGGGGEEEVRREWKRGFRGSGR